MQASVKIMDIDVDMMSNDIFIEKINEYLMDEKLQVIFFASTEVLNRAVEDEEYRKIIDTAELFLPGEEALLINHHSDVLEAGDMVVNCHSFGLVLEKLKKENRSIFIVSKGEDNLEKLISFCKRMQPELEIVGSCIYTDEQDDGVLLNEINNHIPDFLLVNLETGVQERWIMEHVSVLNAKLCIAIGGVADSIIAGEKGIPTWIAKLHLSKLYHMLVREQRVKKSMRAKVFRKKVKKYHSQVEENKDH